MKRVAAVVLYGILAIAKAEGNFLSLIEYQINQITRETIYSKKCLLIKLIFHRVNQVLFETTKFNSFSYIFRI